MFHRVSIPDSSVRFLCFVKGETEVQREKTCLEPPALNPLPPNHVVMELGLDPRFPSLPLTPHFHTEGLQPDSGPHWGTVC